MKTFQGILIGLGVLIGLCILGLVGFYNGTVALQEDLNSLNAQVQSMYERRVDLVPQVAAVVKKYAEHEKGTLE